MSDRRKKDINWAVADDSGKTADWEQVQVAVLMDIRDELKQQNQRLGRIEDLARCVNVQRGFIAMNRLRLHIEKHGARPKPAKKKAAT